MKNEKFQRSTFNLQCSTLFTLRSSLNLKEKMHEKNIFTPYSCYAVNAAIYLTGS
jgi:hypothetical protein